ncbi:hypothetical protein ACEQ8H_008449 [Pleosporales sp. CAS-2024a]
MPYDAEILLPTLVGSLSSCLASVGVLVSYVIWADEQRSFRHVLVLNLAVAADFSIFAIAVITLLTITRKTYMPDASRTKKVLVCGSVWIIPTITATTAVLMQKMQPATGNWCWIDPKPRYLRYVLGHGWRFCIVIVTMAIYLYIWLYMRRHFRNMKIAYSNSYNQSTAAAARREYRKHEAYELKSESQTELHTQINVDSLFEVKHSFKEGHDVESPPPAASGGIAKKTHFQVSELEPSKAKDVDVESRAPMSPMSPGFTTDPSMQPSSTTPGMGATGVHISSNAQAHQLQRIEREIKRMLLINTYPILYIILWAPGIINRFVEAFGHKSRTLAMFQCSTQFVGLANAIIYAIGRYRRGTIRSNSQR